MKPRRPKLSASSDGFAPDRTVAILASAISVGLWLIWFVDLAHSGTSESYTWLRAIWSDLGYWSLDSIYGIWLCAGIYAGRRWAFVGKCLHSAFVVSSFLYYREGSPYVLVELGTIAYCLLRLVPLLGPRLVRAEVGPSFLPDRVFAAAYLILLAITITRQLGQPRPETVSTVAFHFFYWVQIAGLVWFYFGLWQSRGWAIVVGLFFSPMGVLALFYDPNERVQWVGAWLGVFYFAARLSGLGPRPQGVLGLRSA